MGEWNLKSIIADDKFIALRTANVKCIFHISKITSDTVVTFEINTLQCNSESCLKTVSESPQNAI